MEIHHGYSMCEKIDSSKFVFRFPFLLNFVPAKKAAKAIITAQRRNYSEVSIPGILLHLNSVLR